MRTLARASRSREEQLRSDTARRRERFIYLFPAWEISLTPRRTESNASVLQSRPTRDSVPSVHCKFWNCIAHRFIISEENHYIQLWFSHDYMFLQGFSPVYKGKIYENRGFYHYLIKSSLYSFTFTLHFLIRFFDQFRISFFLTRERNSIRLSR